MNTTRKSTAGRSRRGTKGKGGSRQAPRWLIVVGVSVAIGVSVVALLVGWRTSGELVAWARLGTQDVHSLAFVDDDSSRLLFGHHGGLWATGDGGRTWSPLPVRDDAMSTSTAADGSVVIAGHNVFAASRDGGSSWSPIEAGLPNLDIHGFTRDPADPARMWAYLATGGLWESQDSGGRWVRVFEGNIIFPLAVREGSVTRLLGVDASGLVRSDDGGRSWSALSMPETFPMTALAATPDGGVVYAGSSDGLFRSADGGRTWAATAYRSSVFALATTDDGRTVAVVSRETEFFRSSDGGSNWPGP
jgi:photosystem II stability/assembly factor-like uncharacterized protein